MKTLKILIAVALGVVPCAAMAVSFATDPLFLASTEPRVMLVASRDHQLSMKAYTDYSDLDGDGTLDTTYVDSIEYYGYFDPGKCYTYSSANSRYEPSGAVTNGHKCGGTTWSGNFLNWAAMTRMDVLRKTFYGGYRSTDTTGASALTVLQRHFLPDDVHAFVKVYNPGSAATLAYYMPSSVVGSNTSISLCNVSMSSSSTLTGQMTSLPNPSIRVAGGSWPQWDSSEVTQCGTSGGTQPTLVIGDYVARVKVCDSGVGLESNCKTYIHPGTGVQTIKPVGLLQRYGDVDETKRVRFGLMTGSYARNKSGGVLRKNVGFIANNNNTLITSSTVCGDNNSNDEIDVCTGQFINQDATQAGIINTLNRLRVAGFNYSTNNHKYSCDSPGILSFTDGQCVDWGNPLSEIYLETLRYFANSGPSSAFNYSDSTILASIPQVTWADPLPSTEWCALSNIIVLSTGLNSFDTDQLASFTPSGGSAINAATLTQTVGDATHENINGGTYLIGDNGTTANNQCTEKTVSNLATAKGICPEVPSLQGGYGIAGLAYAPKTIDLRPGYSALRTDRWQDVNQDWALRQPINTYTVQLAESLPSFAATVGSGTMSLLPACQANSNGSASAWPGSTGWRNCSMTNLIVEPNVAMADVGDDHTAKSKTCSGNGTTSKCFTVAWEDSTWGNDYDMDGIQRLGFCVGSACSTFKMLCPTTSSAYATVGPWTTGSNQMVIATCTAQANAGHALTFGYTVTGSSNDGAFFPILRPGSKNFNVGSPLVSGITVPNAATFTQGSSAGALLKNPLWYAAKYGGFTESTPATGTPNPNLASEWDSLDNATNTVGSDGIPDNYYDVKNPANLYTALGSVFDRAAETDSAASSVATSSTSLNEQSYIFQAKFSPIDWSGEVLAYRVNEAGVLTTPAKWNAADKLANQSAASRVIITKGASDGVSFEWANLTTGEQAALNTSPTAVVDGCGPERLAYLRGDDTNEGDVGNFACASGNTTTKFRTRESKLGDIVNSNPWYVGAPSAAYLNSVHPGYSAFRTRYLARKPVVYSGANDGMLHGFDASIVAATGEPTSSAGNEVLAYVPPQVYSNLSWLSARNYNKNHRYLVDGSPFVGDAYLDKAAFGSTSTDKWRSVLVGGLNSGGKGYFALDVTNPADSTQTTAPTFSTTNAAALLLWEFTDANDADMGYSFNLPPQTSLTGQAKQIAKMENGKWAVVLGNGYNSAAGKAVLYILFIEEGVDGWSTGDFVKLVADSSGSNGLSTPVPFDTDGNGKADVIYAGDLKGNLWKFDVRGSDTALWVVGTRNPNPNPDNVQGEGLALFQAKDASNVAQPIISPPEAVLHPNGGILVLVGTGKYLETSDVTSTQTQTFYGVWDNSWRNLPSPAAPVVPLQRSNLLAQTISLSGSYRTVTQNAYSDSDSNGVPDEEGWRIDLPTSKERVTGIPKVINGILFFNTIIPSTSACESGGTGWLMALAVASGSLLSEAVFDANGDGEINADDLGMAGSEVGMSPGGSLLIRGAGDALGVVVTNDTNGALDNDGDDEFEKVNLGAGVGGRVTWREILR